MTLEMSTVLERIPQEHTLLDTVQSSFLKFVGKDKNTPKSSPKNAVIGFYFNHLVKQFSIYTQFRRSKYLRV